MLKLKKYFTGRLIVAFLLFSVIPLLNFSITPFYSIRIYLIHLLLSFYFIFIIIKFYIKGTIDNIKLSVVDLLFLGFYLLYFISAFTSSNGPVSLNAVINEFPFIMIYISF
ncbi:hypothetical protein ACFL20_13685 [Spirochaetota bacterium]